MKKLLEKLDINVKMIDYKYENNQVIIELKSKKKSVNCPYCGKSCTSTHSNYTKDIKDLPIQEYKTILRLHTRLFLCKNKKCKHSRFAERFNFYENYSRMTNRLKERIVNDSKGMSARASKLTINAGLVNVSDDTILRLIKKTTNINTKVKKVCIDDFALKKRNRYGTVMVDIETGNIVDLIESRELEDVEKWLENFKNITVVSRDGSITYNAATTNAHPDAIQVSDRFHILKNLTEYGKKYLKRLLKIKVELNVVTVAKTKEIKQTKLEYKQEDLKNKKWELIQEVQGAYQECHNIRKISRDFGLHRRTVEIYINIKEPPIHASKGIEKTSKLDEYKELIIAMNNDNKNSRIIYNEIKEYEYNGSKSLLRHYLSKLKKNNITGITKKETICRNTLVSLLYKELDNVKNITREMFDTFSKLYPEATKIYEIVRSFKEIMFSKKVDKLDNWIIENRAKNISEINSFINGIKRDIKAVKNAIKYDYNNGLAEGTVNKIKVVKRIMYGRCSFGLLRKKLLLL